MALPANGTLLVISTMGMPLWAARGLTQTLTPIEGAANISRDIDGVAMDLSYEQFRKYASEITCTDTETPSLDGIWPGMVFDIDCVAELSYLDGSDAGASRTVVEDSTRTEGDINFYRPRLTMMLESIEIGFAEWEADYTWKMRWVEV